MIAIVSWPIARATARERGLATRTLVVSALLVVLAMARGPALPGTEWFSGLSEFWLFALALVLGAGALSSEVESGHAQLVLLRPITRAQWTSGRLLGVAFVFCAAGALTWACAFLVALLRGDAGPLGLRAILLPIALLPHLGWLATLVALSAVLPGWTNAGVLLGVRFGWFVARTSLPLLLPKWNLAPWLLAIDPWFGPQDAFAAGDIRWGRAGWDLLWIALAWLAAVQLFRRRELAKRRT